MPGRYARRLQRRRTAARWGVTVGSLTLAALAAGMELPVVAIGLVAGGMAAAARLQAGASRAAAGARAEAEVAAHLAGTRIAGVLWGHRLPGRRGDVDLIALGPCLAAVEIKHGSGRVRVNEDGRVRVGGRWLPGAPGNQAVFNARALGRALDTTDDVDAVLCVVGMRGRAQRLALAAGDLVVTSARRLPRTLRRLPARLPRADGRRIVEDLRRMSRPRSGRP